MTTLINTALANNFYVEPLNVNPNMLIDQINEGSLYTVSSAAVQGPDGVTGWATGAGVFKMRRTTDPDNAAKTCLEVTCTTADASIGATDAYRLYWGLEGYDVSDLAFGTAGAQSLTLMMRIKSNVTGTFGVAFQNNTSLRRYIGTTTITSTAETDYAITLTADTSGTWLYTNGGGLFIYFTLAAGSNFQAAAGSWGAGAELTTSAQANFMSSNTNVLYIKKFHVIPGNVVRAYKPADMQRELAKAQRYLYAVGGNASNYGIGRCYNATDSDIVVPMKVTLRANPTFSNSSGTYTVNDGTGTNVAAAISAAGLGTEQCRLSMSGSVPGWSATYRPVILYGDATAKLIFNARLS